MRPEMHVMQAIMRNILLSPVPGFRHSLSGRSHRAEIAPGKAGFYAFPNVCKSTLFIDQNYIGHEENYI